MDRRRQFARILGLLIGLGVCFFLYQQIRHTPPGDEIPIEVDYPVDSSVEPAIENGAEISLTALVELIKQGNVTQLEIGVDTVEVLTADERSLTVKLGAVGPYGFEERLVYYGVTSDELRKLDIVYLPVPTNWLGRIANFAPIILIGVFFFWLIRRSAGAGMGGGSALGFGKSRAKRFSGTQTTVTFDDVGGLKEVKEELEEVVHFLRSPERYVAMGARVPKGVLLVGPPGCGKTLLARAVAGEASVPFFSISGSEFVEMFVGVGASRARDLFDQAKRNTPCIIFIDEVEGIGKQRGIGLGGGSHDEREQTLNQIMTEMDGFWEHDTQVVVLAATNRPDMLDPAFLRPGRFDRRVLVDRPDREGRKAIFEVHLPGKPLAGGLTIEYVAERLARLTVLLTGADIESIVNEAAILAVRRDREDISMGEFTEAIDRARMGPEWKSRRRIERERVIFAHHEAGHTIVHKALPGCDPPSKVTIISRGFAEGYMMPSYEEDRTIYTEDELRDKLAGMLGGRAAEELFFRDKDVTGGAGMDLQQATELAQKMVRQWGMGKRTGLRSFGRLQEQHFLGEMYLGEKVSEETLREVDLEIKELINEAHARARKILEAHRDTLDNLARGLLEKETLEGEELERILAPVERKKRE